MRLGEPPESNVHDVGVGRVLEQSARDARGAAGPRRAVVESTRLGPGCFDQLPDALGGGLGRDQQNERRSGDLGHADKVLHRIQRQVLVEMADDGVAVGGEHQRVAVGRSLGHAGSTREPRAVLDDHLFAPALLELVGNHAGEQIGHASGRERHDDADKLLRIPRGSCASAPDTLAKQGSRMR